MSVKGKDLARDIDNCVICLEPISEKAVASPCHHTYDYLCLLNWLEVRQSCPLCNTTIEHVDVVDVASGKVNRHLVEPPKPTPQTPQSRTQESLLSLRDRPPRRRRRRPPTPPPISENVTILRRRFVYKHQLRSHHIGSNRISRFQNFTPAKFLHDPELQSRARNFVRRELQVFEWIQAENNSEFLLEYIIAILKTMDIKSASGAAEDMLTDFLGRGNARVFLHELHAFLRSPFTNLSHFDSFAQYTVAIPTSFENREAESLVISNGGDEVEGASGGVQDGGRSLVGRAERSVDPERWRKGPYTRERAPGGRQGSYDSYRPDYTGT